MPRALKSVQIQGVKQGSGKERAAGAALPALSPARCLLQRASGLLSLLRDNAEATTVPRRCTTSPFSAHGERSRSHFFPSNAGTRKGQNKDVSSAPLAWKALSMAMTSSLIYGLSRIEREADRQRRIPSVSARPFASRNWKQDGIKGAYDICCTFIAPASHLHPSSLAKHLRSWTSGSPHLHPCALLQ